MATYRFRYANAAGGVVRNAVMQCQSDSDAIDKARETMKEPYTRLEIFEEERTVHSQMDQPSLALS